MSKVDNESNPIDLNKLKQMIKDGLEAIPYDHKTPQAVLMIGDTGVGKSTIMSYLSGSQMKVRYQGLKPTLDNIGPSKIKIGHEKTSQTSVPTRVEIHEMAFYDCPGFKDNQGEQRQISNSFFVQRLLDIYQKVKLVLVVDESHISEARAEKLPKLIRNLRKSFKTFDDIKQGVLLIINRAASDHTIQDYHKEIRKMIQLKNQSGSLFTEQERLFVDYLMFKKRVLLFKQAGRNNSTSFEAGEYQKSIIPAINGMNFVKSRHIQNILSQSAKLAIRDFIDEITARSNVKIELICAQIIDMYSVRLRKIQKDIQGVMAIKDSVINLAEKIKSSQKEDILPVLQSQLPRDKLQDFEQDFASVLFFKGIYDKTSTYFTNLVNKIYAQLSHLLTQLDKHITGLQRDEQQRIQREKQEKAQKIRQQKRQQQKKIALEHCGKMDQLKIHAQHIIEDKRSLIQEIKAAMRALPAIEEELRRVKVDAVALKKLSKEIDNQFERINVTFFQKKRA